MKPVIAFFRRKDIYLGISRYLLGFMMIPYGLTKIMRTQFVVYPFSTWQLPLESLSGINLTWAFLGHSAWFQILLGFLELIPALLLLFRRTTLLGAILMLPMTLNVLLINYAFQLWDGTKNMAVMLFALNCLVLIFEHNRIKVLLQKIVSQGLRIKLTFIELAANTALILVIGYYAITPLLDYKRKINELTGDWHNQRPAEWILRNEKLNDSTLAYREMKCYFSPIGNYEEVGNTHNLMLPNKYTVDTSKHALTFIYEPQGQEVHCTYSLLADTGLKVEIIVDSAKHSKLIQLFSKRIIHAGGNL